MRAPVLSQHGQRATSHRLEVASSLLREPPRRGPAFPAEWPESPERAEASAKAFSGFLRLMADRLWTGGPCFAGGLCLCVSSRSAGLAHRGSPSLISLGVVRVRQTDAGPPDLVGLWTGGSSRDTALADVKLHVGRGFRGRLSRGRKGSLRGRENSNTAREKQTRFRFASPVGPVYFSRYVDGETRRRAQPAGNCRKGRPGR